MPSSVNGLIGKTGGNERCEALLADRHKSYKKKRNWCNAWVKMGKVEEVAIIRWLSLLSSQCIIYAGASHSMREENKKNGMCAKNGSTSGIRKRLFRSVSLFCRWRLCVRGTAACSIYMHSSMNQRWPLTRREGVARRIRPALDFLHKFYTVRERTSSLSHCVEVTASETFFTFIVGRAREVPFAIHLRK